MENTISIKQLIQLILSKIWVVILAAIVAGSAAFSYSKFVMPLQYQSYTSLFVKNTERQVETVNNYDINTSRNLASTYMVVMKDDAVMKKLSDKLIEKYGNDEITRYFTLKTDADGVTRIPESKLRDCITMTAVDQTEVIRITAVTESPELSADICNYISEIAPDFLIRVVGAGSVESIGSADVNTTPVGPNVVKNSAIGIFAGIALAVAVIFLIDFFDNTIKDKELLYKQFKKPIVGEVQYFHNDKKRKKKKNDISTESRDTLLNSEVPFYITESYKAMRTNLTFSLSTSDKKIIAISSAMPGEGKSTTSANIAIALAQTDSKVLLIDADLRKPVQHKTFSVKNKQGLSSILGKMKKTDECIQKTSLKNLDVLTSGPKPPNPSELLASAQTGELLKEVSETYDYIIIDTPPVNVVSDILGLNNYIAGIILVLRYGITTYEEVSEAMKNMKLADSNVMGFILNDVSKKSASYHSYKYKYKDKYGYKSGYGYGYGTTPTELTNDDDAEEAKPVEKASEEPKKSDNDKAVKEEKNSKDNKNNKNSKKNK